MLILNSHYPSPRQFYNDFEKFTDEDLCHWIIPLAMQFDVPAVKVVRFGMLTPRRRFWTEQFLDEETNEIVEIECSEIIDGETYFTRDEVLLRQIDGMIEYQLKSLPTGILHELFFDIELSEVTPYQCLDDFLNLRVMRELSDRDDKSACETLGNYYRDGREEVGIFIDYDRAKSYYDRAGWNVDYDPAAYAAEHRQDSIGSIPDFATFVVEGAEAPVVKQLIESLNRKFGEQGEPFYYLPLEVVMKSLVGSDAYAGHIQSLTEHSPGKIEFTAEFFGCYPDCLKCALEQSFPDLNVNFIVTDFENDMTF